MDGVLITNSAFFNGVFDDWIGSNAAGDGLVRNGANGVEVVNAGGNQIGGHSLAGEGNNIAGNSNGVFINGAFDTYVYGNSIGVLSPSTRASINTGRGIVVQNSSNVVIGAAEDLANDITGNGSSGICILNSLFTKVQYNAIYRNSGTGVVVSSSTHTGIFGNSVLNNNFGVLIGDDGNQDWNVIANTIDRNSLGDLLTPTGSYAHVFVTSSYSGSIHVEGMLQGTPDTAYQVDLFASPGTGYAGSGEGEVYLGTQTLTTDDAGSLTLRRLQHGHSGGLVRHDHRDGAQRRHVGVLAADGRDAGSAA